MSESPICRKCGKLPAFRHHKGNDGFFGQYNKSILRNYQKFLDSVRLCFDCHCIIHYIYDTRMALWMNRTPQGATQARGVCISVCDDWLAGKIPTPKVPKKYIAEFKRSFDEWVSEQSATGSMDT